MACLHVESGIEPGVVGWIGLSPVSLLTVTDPAFAGKADIAVNPGDAGYTEKRPY